MFNMRSILKKNTTKRYFVTKYVQILYRGKEVKDIITIHRKMEEISLEYGTCQDLN